MKRTEGFLGGLGVGAALAIALGAVSLFWRPSLAGPGQSRPAPRLRPANGRAIAAPPAPLPPDFLDVCRNAGL